ncbi:MAG: hypothetical protein AAF589_08335 [Planctomycetota bacterium]
MPRLAACLAIAAALLAGAASADAQYVTYYSPVVAPAPVVVAPPVYTVARPVYAPPVYAVARPVVTTVASPVVTTVASPVVTTVARPVYATKAYAPTPVVRTRFRPLLGGAVSRVRYRYTPVTVYGY